MPTQLHIYDFDKTLFRSPEKPANWSHGWWGRPESLNPPCVPERPGSEWWNPNTVSRAKRSISDPDVYAALVTGRLLKRFRQRVHSLLRQAGLRFDGVYLTPGGSTFGAKLAAFAEMLKQYPEITTVEIWDDRSEHIGKFKAFFERQGLNTTAHLINSHTLPPECPPPEETAAHRVTARWLAASSKELKDLEKEDLHIKELDQGHAAEFVLKDNKGSEVGHVRIRHRRDCGTWEVMNSHARGGWGPFLYDVAMEWAGKQGIMPDRGETSSDARKIWDYYYRRRSDVWKYDISSEVSDCPFWADSDEDDWYLDFRYVTKAPKLLSKIRAMGRWA